jgi:6-phospho-3-hexuloisomerase
MMKKYSYINTMLEDMKRTFGSMDEENIEELISIINRNKRIFIAGVGRTGLMMKAFAMRLMHLGFEVYFIGEVLTPSITCSDLLIIGSGSGNTGALKNISEKAKNIGAEIILITESKDSFVAKLSSIVILVPTHNLEKTRHIMKSFFEQCLLLLLDAVIDRLKNINNIEEKEMSSRHANLE